MHKIFLPLNRDGELDAYAILVVDPVVGCNLFSAKSSVYLLTESRVTCLCLYLIVTDDCNTDKLRAEHRI